MKKDNILLVDDDPRVIQVMARILAPVARLRFAAGGEEALRLAHEAAPDLILLDAEMPGMSGFQTCEALKSDAELADIPVIFVTGHSEPAFEVAGFELGAVDFIVKPVSPPLLLARVKTHLRLKHMTDELRCLSTTDVLTRAANRRRFDQALESEWLRVRRAGEPISLLLVDVDHFKLFNDRYGHPQGDTCLRRVAEALESACLRPGDLVARYGGEEFALLLPCTPRDGAEHMAHRVLNAIEALQITHASSPTSNHVTASIGIGVYDRSSAGWSAQGAEGRAHAARGPECTAEDLLHAADLALYAAKGAGRAQAQILDAANARRPDLAHEISPLRRESAET